MQHEIIHPHDLLLPNGELAESGWARSPLLEYNREQIGHPAKRIKEWHYFFCGDETCGIGFFIADVGLLHTFSLSFMDFQKKFHLDKGSLCLPKDSLLQLPRDAYGSLKYGAPGVSCELLGGRERILFKARWERYDGKHPLDLNLTLHLPPGDTLCHYFPFVEEAGQFFYAHKRADIPLEGELTLGEIRHTFDPRRAFAVQDWGRGVWPGETHAYWGGGNGSVGGRPFSFNIGWDYQKSDTSEATENALFYDGRIHKLEEVTFCVNEKQKLWLEPWTFTSSDGRFEMRMDPIMDRFTKGPQGPSHQVFGWYSGTVILDDGQKLPLERIFGFAEKNVYRWGLVENLVVPLVTAGDFFRRIFKGPRRRGHSQVKINHGPHG
ncbi:MAG: DUF2804 domain-containing protein [Spirochaetales bacterium]|jgi:hypothetical protein|nr:DUF2804 domain-containing protein [Spirochaetales bacterium]